VAATDAVDTGASVPGAVGMLVDAIRPAVQDADGLEDPRARLDVTVRTHTRTTVQELILRSDLLRETVDRGELGIAAAWYSLSSGEVRPA
jgi:carbonic anhydrase